MLWSLTDHENSAFSTNGLTVTTHFLHRGANLHKETGYKLKAERSSNIALLCTFTFKLLHKYTKSS